MAESWRWAAARAAGVSHLDVGTPCQDAWAVDEILGPNGSVLVAAVSDGAGSARNSLEGARGAVRGTILAARRWFASHEEVPTRTDIAGWVSIWRGWVRHEAELAQGDLRDYACTLVAVLATPTCTLVVHVGDGACVVEDMNGAWQVGSWPENGAYANETFFLTDPAGARLRFTFIDGPVQSFALFTDGIEDLALQRRERTPFPGFFDAMLAPVRAAGEAGRDRSLSRSLRTFLTSDRVNARTDDDKTLILAARRP